MLCILSTSYLPEFNLAAEEYLFRNFTNDIFFLYVNEPSVVVGKHQNAMAETNPTYVFENGIKVIRRLSGGGAVYHDLGNLNFSFHQTVEDTAKISFKSFNEPIVQVLKQMGIPAEISQRNDIFVNGFKVSGHAEHVFRKRILSHGTLLFNAQRENLSKALKNTSGTYTGKAIQSVRSKVANIVDFLENPMKLNEFIQRIVDFMLSSNSQNTIYQLNQKDISAIDDLAKEKYSTTEWNFGYSPKYQFEKEIETSSGKIKASLFIEKGKITTIELEGNIDAVKKKAIQQTLLNGLHDYQFISQTLKSTPLNLSFNLLDLIF